MDPIEILSTVLYNRSRATKEGRSVWDQLLDRTPVLQTRHRDVLLAPPLQVDDYNEAHLSIRPTVSLDYEFVLESPIDEVQRILGRDNAFGRG